MDLGLGLRRALARITGAAIIDERTVREFSKDIQRVLIANDTNVRLVLELTKKIENRILAEKQLRGVNPKEQAVKIVYDELSALLGEKYEPRVQRKRIMMLGLFGSGKTTSSAKIAKFYRDRGLKVGLICADVHRPAAYEQLKQLAEKAGIAFYGERGNDAAAVAQRGAEALSGCDVLILDSAGRDAFDAELSAELKRVDAAFKPDERLLVVSADLGQIAGRQADEFNKAVGLSGVVVTKLDGSGKGGGALSSVAASGAKIAFVGTGEKLDDIAAFDAKKFVGGLLGFADLEALLEKVKKVAEEERIKPEQLLEEKFTIKAFYEQMKAAKKLGPMKSVLQMMGVADVPDALLRQGEGKLRKYEAMINSMTEAERSDAGLLRNKTRIERIAKGSGTAADEVRAFLSEFEKMEKMLSRFQKDRGLRKRMEKMFRGGLSLPGIG
jgi:signal recognition particle subunit SRP54